MEREEASKWLESIKRKYIHGGDEEFGYKRKMALDMAIKALQLESEYISKMDEVRRAYDKAVFESTKTDPTTITEDMSNGDVIKAMFPSAEYTEDKLGNIWIASNVQLGSIILRPEWWNAPYNGNFAM